MASIHDVSKRNKEEAEKEETVLGEGVIVIKNNTYKLQLLKWRDALDLWEVILKKILPSVGSGFDYFQHDPLDGSPSTFTQAFMHLAQNLDGSTLGDFSEVLFDGATVNGIPLILKDQTSAFLGDWRKLFIFAIKENFKGFFEEGWETTVGDLMAIAGPIIGQKESQPE